MRPLLVVLALLALAPLAPLAGATPQDDWMIHVNKNRDTGEYSYLPPRIEAYPDAAIQLMVFGEAQHTMTSVDGAWPEADARGGGEVGTADFRAPTTPGEYRFYCRYHATPETMPGEGLAGVVVVVPRPGDETPAPNADADAGTDGEAEENAARDTPAPELVAILGMLAIAAFFVTRRRGGGGGEAPRR